MALTNTMDQIEPVFPLCVRALQDIIVPREKALKPIGLVVDVAVSTPIRIDGDPKDLIWFLRMDILCLMSFVA